MMCNARTGFDASFVQLGAAEMSHDLAAWKRDLEVMRALGVRTVVLQYSGDEHGSYDHRTADATPVRSLLQAAQEFGIDVFLGLFADPSWPDDYDAATRLPAPLDEPQARAWLLELSQSFTSFAGFYIPQEIDEQTWSSPQQSAEIGAFLRNTAAQLRGMAPHKPIAIAPFYAETSAPAAYAAFWQRILRGKPIDILMLQDGVGARGTSDVTIVKTLQALRPVLDARHIELWSVVETFKQVSGSPVNEGEFSAIPADFERLRAALTAERPWVRRMIAFSVLDYMHPRRGAKHKLLYDAYRANCAR